MIHGAVAWGMLSPCYTPGVSHDDQPVSLEELRGMFKEDWKGLKNRFQELFGLKLVCPPDLETLKQSAPDIYDPKIKGPGCNDAQIKKILDPDDACS